MRQLMGQRAVAGRDIHYDSAIRPLIVSVIVGVFKAVETFGVTTIHSVSGKHENRDRLMRLDVEVTGRKRLGRGKNRFTIDSLQAFLGEISRQHVWFADKYVAAGIQQR